MVLHTRASRTLRRGVAATGIVVIWWGLIWVAVVQTAPASVASAGNVGHVHLPGLLWLPIPVERAAFDESERGFRESDEAVIEHAFTAYEWIRVSHRQAVHLIEVDGEAVQVEMLEGAYAGRRGWMKARQLEP